VPNFRAKRTAARSAGVNGACASSGSPRSNGIDATRAAIERLLAPSLARAAEIGAGLDWKTSLQEACAARGLGSVSYEVEGLGPDHLRTFTATVLIGGAVAGTGQGSAKKHAEQEAAAVAYASITSDTP